VAGAFQQADVVLAEGQDEKVAVAGEKRQQRLQVKAWGDDEQFFQVEGQAIGVKLPRRGKQRQAVARVPPKGGFVQERLGRFQHLPRHGGAQAGVDQPRFRLSQQVLEAKRVLLGLPAGAMGGHKDRDAGAGILGLESAKVVQGQNVHTGTSRTKG